MPYFCKLKPLQMKCLSLLLLICVASAPGTAQDPFLEDFKLKWKNAKEYTMEFARAMPADKYGYTPTPEEMTFARQLIHMCGNMIWLSTDFLNAPAFPLDMEHPSEKKEDVLRLLEASFDHTAKAIEKFPAKDLETIVDFFAGPMKKRRVFFLLTDHVTHHRGQLVVYLRLNHITPPRYRGW
jgi:uncharacterized damage-inducible protein DinB